MTGVWTLTYNNGGGAVEQTCAAWGLTAKPVIKTRDRNATGFSFRMVGAAPEGTMPFPFYPALLAAGNSVANAELKSRVVIKHYSTWTGGTGWSGLLFTFVGYLSAQPADVDGKSQGVTLEFKDAIWLLQNTTFQQLWTQNTTGSSSQIYVSRCVLFMDINSWVPNVYQSVQWQINQIITFAAACGIAIAPGTIDYSGWYLNYYHCRAVSCWDAILKCLEPIPDAKVWIDGSASTPALHVRTRAAIAALSAPTTTGPGPITMPYKGADAAGRRHFSSHNFTPRYDLIPPQVVLQYQTNTTVNGKAAPSFSDDIYPASVGGVTGGQMPFAMVCPIDLTGASITTETGTLDCEPLACIGGSHAAKRAWWASKRGGEQHKLADFRVRFGADTLADAVITNEAGTDVTATVLANYPNRIVKGTYHAWMKNGTTQINAMRVHVKVTAQFAEYDVAGSTPAETDTNGNLIKKSNAHDLHYDLTVTNAPSGVTTFNGWNITAFAETPVSSLAQNIYNSRAELDYDGEHEIIDAGIVGTSAPLSQIIGHWNVLNFSGGLAAWAGANMTISGTDINLLTNHVRIQVGPAKHLQPQDWNSMLQFFRYRRIFMPSSQRATGYGDPNNTVDMALNTPDGNTAPGLAVDSQNLLVDYATSGDPTSSVNGQSNLDAGLITQIHAAATTTPVSGGSTADIRKMQPREVQMCDSSGNLFYAIVHCTAGYTKS